MRFPISTGAVARLLGTTEPKVAETVRRGRVTPPPDVVSGRRLWTREHVVQAANALHVPIPPSVDDGANGKQQ